MNFILLLCCLVASSASSASISATEKELQCFSEKRVYHKETDGCYFLMEQGPCKWGETLLLELPKNDSTLSINPICVKERCVGAPIPGDYLWSCTSTCVSWYETYDLCNETRGEVYRINQFGGGECSCSKYPPRARLNGDRKNPCYRLYTQGPCDAGKMLVVPDEDSLEGMCIDDPCYEETIEQRKNGTIAANGTLALYADGHCYELNTQGPCSYYDIFEVDTRTKKPGCVFSSSLTTSVSDFLKCDPDENGKCRGKPTINKEKAEQYLRYLEIVLKNHNSV